MASISAHPRKRPHPTSSSSTRPPHTKRPRPNTTTSTAPLEPEATPTPTPTPLAPLKKRLRDLTRLLASNTSSTLPATIRSDHERELQSLRSEIADAEIEAAKREDERKRNKIIGRYHRVRFFERRKAERRLKALRKSGGVVDADGEIGAVARTEEDGAEGVGMVRGETRRLQRRAIHDAEVDLQYTMFYPLDEPYVSLFAEAGFVEDKSEGEQDGESGHDGAKVGESREREKPKMWYLVEEATEQGQTALDALREGRWSERYQEVAKAVEVKSVRKTPKVAKAKGAKPAVPQESATVHAPNSVKEKKINSQDVTAPERAAADPSKDTLHLIRGNRRMRRAAEAEEKARRATAADEGDQKGLDFFE